MFIATPSKWILAPGEPHVVAAAQTHCAPLERDLEGGGGYKHLVPPGP
jgi:hypothetical protein